MFLLDTDHVSIIMDQTQPDFSRLSRRMAQHPPTAFFFNIVSFHEQVLGAQSYLNRARNASAVVAGYRMLEKVRRTYAAAQVLLFDLAVSAQFAILDGHRLRVGTMDLRIAAIALHHRLKVLTRNLRDFGRVPGLVAEDWTT